jgi:hypothetical protein
MKNEEKNTHWKVFQNPKYIGAYSFRPNEKKIVTIKSFCQETVTSNLGTQECLVLYFDSDEKPMIAKPTNCRLISSALKSENVADWVGKKIELYVAEITVKKEKINAVRVKPTAPIEKKERLSLGTPRWTRAVQQLAENKITIEEIKNYVVLSEEDEKEILFQADELAAKFNEEKEKGK